MDKRIVWELRKNIKKNSSPTPEGSKKCIKRFERLAPANCIDCPFKTSCSMGIKYFPRGISKER